MGKTDGLGDENPWEALGGVRGPGRARGCVRTTGVVERGWKAVRGEGNREGQRTTAQ